ncbi:MAG: TolC family protein [Gallionellaceae bacterium]|nr:TolC family protein [Gallionellaceae bacterium]
MSCPKCQGRVRRSWWLPFGLLVIILLLGAAHAGAPAPLGLGDAARLATTRQPFLEAQAAAVEAADATAVAAAQWPDPKLRLGLASLPTDSFSFVQEPMTQLTVGVSQTVPGGGRAGLASRRGELAADQARRQYQAGRKRVARDAGLAWLSAWLPEASAGLVRRLGQEWDRQLEWAEVAYKTGKLALDEVAALRDRVQATLDRMDDLERQGRRGRAALARWLGGDAARPLADLAAAAELPPLAELATRLEQHPELTTLSGAVAVARAEVEIARAAYRPDLTFDLGYGHRGDGRPDFVSFGIGMDLPLFSANRQDRRLAASEARVTQAEQMLVDRRLSLRAELEEALAEWQAARARIARYEKETLPLAGQRIDSTLAAYGSDRASYGRIAEARRAELEARLGLLGQRAALARAQLQIDYLTTEIQP